MDDEYTLINSHPIYEQLESNNYNMEIVEDLEEDYYSFEDDTFYLKPESWEKLERELKRSHCAIFKCTTKDSFLGIYGGLEVESTILSFKVK